MISYCITVYNEVSELLRLITVLKNAKKENDEIVIVQTFKDETDKTAEFFLQIKQVSELYATKHSLFQFKNNFSDLKNYMNSQASLPYILNLDADESISTASLNALRKIILKNDIDLYYIPRINTVKGLTDEDIKKWSWNVNQYEWVNWPDYQPRLYKNLPHIRWGGAVHESLTGFVSSAFIEADGSIAIIHEKNIDKQRAQNEFYESIIR